MKLRSFWLGVSGCVVLLAMGASEAPAQPMYPAQGNPYGQPYAPQYQQPQYGQSQAYGQQAYAQPYPQQGYEQPHGYQQNYAPQQGYAQPQSAGQAMNADQLEQLVAPIALYPDTLVAQMLAASTYPAQVAEADRWLSAQGNASPYEIAGGADAQNWDPSVKGLTAFPQVLAEMDRNPRWMTDLGNAYYNQPQDVLEAVQVMRQRAQAAGTLQSSPEENVSYNAGAIELAPPNPQMVYVPQYNPWTVYGDPVTPYPGFSLIGALGSFFGSGAGSSVLSYGLGIAMAAFNHTPFGWLSWGLSWLSHAILFNHSDYTTASTSVADWGIRGGGLRAFGGSGGSGWTGGGSRYPAQGGYGREPEHFAPIERRVQAQQMAYGRPATRPAVEAYNRAPSPIARTQAYSRPESRLAYGPSYYNGGGAGSYGGGAAGYAGRRYAATPTYRSEPMEAYRGGSETSFGRGGFDGRSSFAGEKAPKSGGFHLFGGGSKEPKFKEPKYKEPKMSSSHSSGGGHSGGGFFGHGGGKHHG